MKRLLLHVAACALLFTACKETGPAIDFGPAAKDTAYMATAETPQQRVVVMEEFTGVSCGPCFLAHKRLKAIEEKYPNRVAVLGLQVFGPAQSKPLEQGASAHPDVWTRNDNRNPKATEIGTDLYGGIGQLPQAGIDRTPVNSTTSSLLYSDNRAWETAVDGRITKPTAANVTVTSTYTDNNHQAIIKVRVAYTQAVAKTQVLNVGIIENNIIDAQEGGDTTDFTQNYTHLHVFRDMLTAPTGTIILSGIATKQPGQVYERTFIYDVNPAWNVENCRIVAYVSNNEGPDKETVQGAETHLK